MSEINVLFGIKYNYLYEIIATTFIKTENGKGNLTNCACMGVRFLDNNYFLLTPYLKTDTYKNLVKNPFISINFVENVFLYAQAALIGENAGLDEREFPDSFFSIEKEIPFLKEAWGVVFGKMDEHQIVVKEDEFGENQVLLAKFKIIHMEKKKESFYLINRAENLALESIILTTRLKIAAQMGKKKLYNEIYQRILYYKEQLERFSKNKVALTTIDFIIDYIERDFRLI